MDTRRTKRPAIEEDALPSVPVAVNVQSPIVDGSLVLEAPFIDRNPIPTCSYGYEKPFVFSQKAAAGNQNPTGDVPVSNIHDLNLARSIPQHGALTEMHEVLHVCGLLGAAETERVPSSGVKPDTAIDRLGMIETNSTRPVVTPPVFKLTSPTVSSDVDDLEQEELRLKIEELEVRRTILELKKSGRFVVSGTRVSPRPTIRHEEANYGHVNQSHVVQSLERSLGSLVQGACLPKIDIDKFDGSPGDFYPFIRSFESNVSDRLSDDGVKLSYLLQYCCGRAKDAIKHCVLMPKTVGFVEATRLLHEQFGRRHDVMQSVSRELFMGPRIVSGDYEGLRKLASQMKGYQTTLSQLNYDSELNCSTNLVKTVERLPWDLQGRWAEVAHRINVSGRDPSFGDLLSFIEERVAIASSQFGQVSYRPEPRVGNFGQAAIRNARCNVSLTAFSPNPHALGCPLCGGAHDLPDCTRFVSQSWEERRRTLKSNGRCFICLKSNHMARTCRVQVRCTVVGCGRRHHTLVHTDLSEPIMEEIKVSMCGATSCSLDGVCLGFVPVKLVGPKGSVTTYAFLDNGSDTTLIDSSLATKLGLYGESCPMKFRTLSGTHIKPCNRVSLSLQSMDNEHSIPASSVYTVDRLPLTQADVIQKSAIEQWSHLKDISYQSLENKSVGILIGCDVPEAHWVLEQRLGNRREPYASRTIFGWCLRGPCHTKTSSQLCVNYVGVRQASLDDMIKEMYNSEFVDQPGPEGKGPSVEDDQALNNAESSIRLIGGHYELGLPWNQAVGRLPDNRVMAERRLFALKKRLIRDPILCSKYSSRMLEHLRKGYISKVTAERAHQHTRWFLPHHPVFNPNKPGKLRIVFDCAAESCGTSLNQALLQGPDLNNTLLGVLLRFRKHSVAVSADIEEMFLQVGVTPSDRYALSFLWWSDESLKGPPDIYEMQVHPFGAKSSPFCASFALRKTASDNQTKFSSKTVDAVNESFYVDDFLMSFESVLEAKDVAGKLAQMLHLGGFRLTKWVSNCDEVVEQFPAVDRLYSPVSLGFVGTEAQRALGVRWQVEKDCFQFLLDLPSTAFTKRGILKCVASLYDPLGIVSPVILPARKLLQDLCHQGAGWDVVIDRKDQVRWEVWLTNIRFIESIELPRCISPEISQTAKLELHMFCDASEVGYGAVGYIRSVSSNGSVRCSFAMGKSRVTPRKVNTIPRLELVAAVLSSRLMRLLIDELRIPVSNVFMWTDSTIVLRYIQNTSLRFATFVANRVKQIHDNTSVSQWRHVPSEQNPADVASRGVSKVASKEMNLWLQGPTFLLDTEECWPKTPTLLPLLQSDPDTRRVVATTTKHAPSVILNHLATRYSSWPRLLRAVAWLSRFVCFVSSKGRDSNDLVATGPLRLAELNASRLKLISLAQESEFSRELDALKTNSESKYKLGKLDKLRPYLCDGVLCLGGRARLSECASVNIYILPSHGTVTDLVVQSYHESEGHMGASHVLACIRKQFWILKGMSAVKRVIRKCYQCRRLSSAPCKQVMAPLPLARVSTDGYPFKFCGVDYFGPFKVKIARSEVKRYGCIFTCLQTRAIHLEIAHTMSTDSFLMALMRFVSRRGAPEVMYSDNGTNFVGADAELKRKLQSLDQCFVSDRLTQRGIDWHFNPPDASHRGGVWERMIRTVRRVLASVTQQQVMCEETLLTYMVEVERIINDRPLIPVYDDPDNPSVLRPNDLLLLRSNVGIMTDNVTLYERYTRGWRQAQHLSCVFWKRWRNEYLPQLQITPKWLKSYRNLQVGDVVLLNGSAPRGVWPYGVVSEIFPGVDGFVRQAVVKTTDGLLRRDVRSLCFMEAVAE